MKHIIRKQFIRMILIVAVLFTLGMDLNVRSTSKPDIPPQPLPIAKTFTVSYALDPLDRPTEAIHETLITMAKPQNKAITKIEKTIQTEQLAQTEQAKQTVQAKQKGQAKQTVQSMPVLLSTSYEVTSYYLNVRANSNVSAKIVNVVKCGDILEVLEETHNDWLKLKDGGYVHSKYVELVGGHTVMPKKTAKASILSAEPKIVNNTNIQLSQLRPSQPTTTVKSDSQLTEEHIIEIFDGTLLADHELEKSILAIEEEYGINAYFTIAVMKLESGHGKSKIARDKNNLFGLNAIDGDAYNKAFSFETKGDSVQKFGQLISDNYIDEGYTSVEKVASKYCQANSKWSSLVMKIMKSDYNKVHHI